MRLALTAFLVLTISLVLGFGVMLAAGVIFTCRSDPAGCGLAQAYQTLFVLIEVVAVLLLFALSSIGKNRERIIRRTMLTLVLVPVILLFLGLASDISSGRSTKSGDIIEVLQLALPFWTIIVAQWWMIRAAIQRRAARAGTNQTAVAS